MTAQLINAADGYHVWSERDDRTLTDVFAIQGDIAEASPTTIAIAAFEVFRQRAAPKGSTLMLPPGCFPLTVSYWPGAWSAHDTLGFQSTNVPNGLSFHAHTWIS